ncbi:MAG: hypothetical protein KC561_01705, partial [Myxococcales bacterium]|nr:hypothetical protein [Myxococcales bacterium]
PEPRIPMQELEVGPEIELLANLAEETEEESDEASGSGGGQALTMEQLMAGAIAAEEEHSMQSLHYDSIAELLKDFRDIADGRIRLRDLAYQDRSGSTSGGDESHEDSPDP